MTSNTSFATQAVASGPMTSAPPSFDGHGWLVIANLVTMTSATLIGVMAITYLVQDGWRHRQDGRGLSPARIWRYTGLLFATGITLRCGVEAASLWAWDPRLPAITARFLVAKRLVDPVAISFGLSGLALFVLSLPGMLEQLRKEPLPLTVWQARPILHRIGWLVLLSAVAAIGVVSTR